MIASLSMIALVSAGLVGLGTITGAYDASHTSEAELSVVQSQVYTIKVQSQCSTLEIKISIVENQIFQMEVSGQNTSRLVEKKRELQKMEQKYAKLECASLE